MHSRQTGSVSLYFTVILLVLLLASVGLGYSVLGELNEMTKKANQATADLNVAEGKILLYEHYVDDLQKSLEKPGVYKGRPATPPGSYTGFDYKETDDDEAQAQQDLDAIAIKGPNPDDLTQMMTAFAGKMSFTPANGLEATFNSAISQYEGRVQAVAAAETNAQTIQGNLDAVNQQFRQATADLARKQGEMQNEMDTDRDNFTRERERLAATLDSARQRTRDLTGELDAEKDARVEDNRRLGRELNTLTNQNSALVAKVSLRNPPQAPDGEIVAANNQVGVAFINLGKKDLLMRGTKFRIHDPVTRAVKAMGEVERVEQERAEVRLYEIKDALLDPVASGDLISNDLYSPNVKRNIALIGRFGFPVSRANLKEILESYGNTVYDKVQVGVDMVIVGLNEVNAEGSGLTPITESEDYRNALRFSAEIVPLNKIRELIRLSDSSN